MQFVVSNMWHNLRNGITYHKPTALYANSKAEAEGVELNTLLKEYPPEQGFTGHSTNAMMLFCINLNRDLTK